MLVPKLFVGGWVTSLRNRQRSFNAKMIVVALRGFLFFGIIVAYSSGVWNLINGYFGKQFQEYLVQHPTAAAPEHPLVVALKTQTIDGDGIKASTESSTIAASFCGVSKEEHRDLLLSMQMNDNLKINNNNKWLMGVGEKRETCSPDSDDDKTLVGNRKETTPTLDAHAAKDGDLTSALNHNPIDETWWSNYYREQQEMVNESGSLERGGDDDNGEWSSNNYCPGPVLVMSEDVGEDEDELNENGNEEMYKGRQKDEESCRNE